MKGDKLDVNLTMEGKRNDTLCSSEAYRKPSLFDGTPDDKSDYNSSYGRHDHQDTDLLPVALLKAGTHK